MRLPYCLDESMVNVRSGKWEARLPLQRLQLPMYSGPRPTSSWRKPIVGPPDRPFAELQVVAGLEKLGWVAAWVYRPRKFIASWEPRLVAPLPTEALALHSHIQEQSNAHAGCWDVFAWCDGQALF